MRPARLLPTVALCIATGFLGTGTPARGPFRLPVARAVPVAYGASGHVLNAGLAQPTALASGDFDEDGVADLISGSMSPDGNVLTLHRGNVDSIFSHSPAARQRRLEGTFSDEPFLPSVRVFQAPVRPDFLAAGDFDNDGHWDVVLAASGEASLYLLPGDGNGGLQPAEPLKLAGTVTTLVAGEINRADGLVDLVVGVGGPDGPALLVFEGPEGALRSAAEVLPISVAPTALLLARLGDGPWRDLAVAAGDELVIVQGRDRRLVLGEAKRAEVGPPVMERIEMPSAIEALAWGDFAREPTATRELALLLEDGTIRLLGRAHAAEESPNLSWETIGKREVLAPRTPATAPTYVRKLLPVRISGSPTEDLAILDAIDGRLDVLAGMVREDAAAYLAHPGVVVSVDMQAPPIAALGMRLNRDALTDLVLLQQGMDGPLVVETAGLATITVNTAADSTATDGTCTLREALNNSNSDSDTTGGDCAAGAGTDAIEFNIGGGGSTATIAPTSALPVITDAVTIDGTTQGCASPPCIVLNGSGAGSVTAGLSLAAGSSSVRGLVVQRFLGDSVDPDDDGHGILITSAGNIVEGNYSGTDVTGTVDLGNTGASIRIEEASDNTLGGTTPAARNLFSGAGRYGVAIIQVKGTGSGNQVLGNHIGTDVTGTVGLGNSLLGVKIFGVNNTIGGTTTGAPNLISGNGSSGVGLTKGAQSNLVLGNHIGTDVTGTIPLGNGNSGVSIPDGTNNTIGGTSVGARNVISGNESNGVFVGGESSGNEILGNYIGTDVTGTMDLGNTWHGVDLYGVSNNTIGGTSVGARNVISGNNFDGIIITLGSSGNVILGNFIGTDVSGTLDLGNTLFGVEVELGSSNNTIGGTSVEARNIISGNELGGVLLDDPSTSLNSVLGNFIGTDVTGTNDLGNTSMGVYLFTSSNNTIGGTTPGARNIISGNDTDGIRIQLADDNEVVGNFIGTDVTGTVDLGNSLFGVRVLADSSNNTIGGTSPGARNIISGGLRVFSGDGNAILGNSIFASSELGIDLGSPGVTPNDLGDGDTGANTLQNFPVLSLAEATPSLATVDGSLNSTSNRPFRIEFFANLACDSTGYGEGSRYLGFADVLTDGTGNVSFSAALSTPVSDGEAISATATTMGRASNTSEFSECLTAICLSTAIFGQTITAPDKNSLSWVLQDDVRFVKGDLADVSSYLITQTAELIDATSLDISSDNPAPGDGLYYLIRSLACGSWQSAPGAESGRDVLP